MRDTGVLARIIVAGALIAIALVLGIFSSETNKQGLPKGSILESVDATVDSLLQEKGVDRKKERKWQVKSSNGMVIRIERRIRVPAELVSLEFNRDLSSAVEPLGAHVSGTERTKESTVVLHVVAGEMTVQTITLEREPRKQH